MTEPRPCSPLEAVERAKRIAGKGGQYILGTGDYRPHTIAGKSIDLPWTSRDGRVGSDCAGFAICWCYRLQRHRPGFASGRVPREYWDQSDVDDDINCNSLIEDSLTTRDICCVVESGLPQLGDLLVYPTLRLAGHPKPFIGHVGIVVGCARLVGSAWTWQHPAFHLLDVAQCRGPDERSPAVVLTDGSLWDRRNEDWPKPAHRTVVLRMNWQTLPAIPRLH